MLMYILKITSTCFLYTSSLSLDNLKPKKCHEHTANRHSWSSRRICKLCLFTAAGCKFQVMSNLKLRTVINFFSNEVNLQFGKSATRYPFKNRDLTHIPFGFLFFRFEYLKFSHEHVTDTRIRSPRVTFFVELLRNFTNHFKSECGWYWTFVPYTISHISIVVTQYTSCIDPFLFISR